MRRPVTSMCRGPLRPMARRAGTSPRSASTLGKMPWASSRSSSIAPSTSRSNSSRRALVAGSAAACSLAIANPMRREISRCWAPSWRSRSSRRRSPSLAATIRRRESCRSRSESFQAASSWAFSCASSATAPAAAQQLGLLGQLRIVHDRRRRAPVALDLGQHAPRRRVRERRAVGVDPAVASGPAEPEPQAGVAERLAQHRFQLIRRRAPERVDHHAAQHPSRKQLRRDQRDQEPVPDRRSRPDDRPLRHREEGVALDLQQARRLVGRLRQQEDDRDRCADHERASPRRRAVRDPPHDEPDRGKRHEDHPGPADAHDVEHQRGLGGDEQPVLGAGRLAGGDRRLAGDLRREQDQREIDAERGDRSDGEDHALDAALEATASGS